MKKRCYDVKDKRFKTHGARGILVCDRWINSFENFILDMGARPSEIHSIDRIDNDGNYEPKNCKWSTDTEQSRNRRTNRWLIYNNTKMLLIDWAEYFGVYQSAIYNLFKSGKTFDEIVEFYCMKYKKDINAL